MYNQRVLNYSMIFLLGIGFLSWAPAVDAADKTTSFKGRVARSDLLQPVADALVSMVYEGKANENSPPPEMRTNANGEFNFESLPPGKYTIQVKIWFDRPEQIPCHDTLAATTREKDSSVVVMPDGDRTLQRVLLSGIKLKAGQLLSKEIDIVCKNPLM
jgi:hypothetical protein